MSRFMPATLAALLITALPVAAVAAPTKPAARAALPRWEGAWIDAKLGAAISGVIETGPIKGLEDLDRDYPMVGWSAPWTPEARAELMQMLERARNLSKADGWGFPMMLNAPAPMEFVIAPDRVVIFNIYREMRVIYTDGRPHQSDEDRYPTTWGDSIGHWEGDTLVIDTIGVRHPLAFTMFAPPLSDDAHYVERIRRTAPDRLESDVTIDDPVKLTAPFHVKKVYSRLAGLDRVVLDGLYNDRTGFKDDSYTIEPPKDEK